MALRSGSGVWGLAVAVSVCLKRGLDFFLFGSSGNILDSSLLIHIAVYFIAMIASIRFHRRPAIPVLSRWTTTGDCVRFFAFGSERLCLQIANSKQSQSQSTLRLALSLATCLHNILPQAWFCPQTSFF